MTVLGAAGPLAKDEKMIRVTRLNHAELVVNAEMIEFIEAAPDTIISLVSGKKVMVSESVDMVIDRVVQYKRSCGQPLVGGDL